MGNVESQKYEQYRIERGVYGKIGDKEEVDLLAEFAEHEIEEMQMEIMRKDQLLRKREKELKEKERKLSLQEEELNKWRNGSILILFLLISIFIVLFTVNSFYNNNVALVINK